MSKPFFDNSVIISAFNITLPQGEMINIMSISGHVFQCPNMYHLPTQGYDPSEEKSTQQEKDSLS